MMRHVEGNKDNQIINTKKIKENYWGMVVNGLGRWVEIQTREGRKVIGSSLGEQQEQSHKSSHQVVCAHTHAGR